MLTTHYIKEAERLCDSIAFIVKGKTFPARSRTYAGVSAMQSSLLRIKTSKAAAEP